MDPQRPERAPGALAGLEALERRSRRPDPAPEPTHADPARVGSAPSVASARSSVPNAPAAPSWPPVATDPVAADPWAHTDPRAQGAPAPTGTPVPRRTRTSVRTKGPFVALMLPAVLGVISLVLLRGSTTSGRGIAGFLTAMLAAPLLPAFGAPLRSGSGAVTGAVVASAALWFVLGAFAGQRATRTPFGGWGRFWSEYLWLAACVWIGGVLAAVASNLVLGRVLL